MASTKGPKHPASRRYTPEEKAQASVSSGSFALSSAPSTRDGRGRRPPAQLRRGAGTCLGATGRHRRGRETRATSADAERMKALKQENRELERANEMAEQLSGFGRNSQYAP